MRYKIDVPQPSAKRLEKNRTFIIEESGAFHSRKYRFPIPDDDTTFVFEFEFQDNNPYINEGWLDANMYYSWHVEYKNSTGSRIEEASVELEEIPGD